MRFGLRIGSKAKKQSAPSPGHDNHERKSMDSGSKDEAFFDSQAWLDSDCEDDFFSVNGDSTPSRGSTSNHQSSNKRTPQLNKNISTYTFSSNNSEPPLTAAKKKLLEFLQEDQVEEYGTQQTAKSERNEFNGNGRLSENSGSDSNTSETFLKDLKHRRDESMNDKQYCCLPSLVHSLSFKGKRR